MDLVVSIPPLIVQQKPNDEDYACGSHYPFRVRTIQLPTLWMFKHSQEKYSLELTNPFTIQNNSSQIIEFPVLFITDIPALCVLIVDSHHYRWDLFANVTIIPTNDTYPHVIVYNYTDKPITVNRLMVTCQIVIAPNPSLLQS